ncbi:hypothetical protein DFQ30_010465 [Apophysomyces sp. BC1015]|nr:hypothetical protein DFQ30_010465 [Apophysomyces sp. BC1015]
MSVDVTVTPPGVIHAASPTVEHVGSKSNKEKSVEPTLRRHATASQRKTALHEVLSKFGIYHGGKRQRSSIASTAPGNATSVTLADLNAPEYSASTVGVLGQVKPAHVQSVLFAMHEAGVRDSSTATMVLEQLQRLNFDQPFSDTPTRVSPDHLRAWRASWKTARVLARTEYSFEVLLKLRGEDPAPLSRGVERDMLQALLQAADRIDTRVQSAQRHRTCPSLAQAALDVDDPSPSGVNRRRQWLQHYDATSQDGDAARMAQVFASAKKFFDKADQPHAAASRPREDRFESFKEKLPPDEVEALFDLEQVFRERGPGTDKEKAWRRLGKFGLKVASRDRQHHRSNLIQRFFGRHKAPLTGFRIDTGADQADETSTPSKLAASASTAPVVATTDDNGRDALKRTASSLRPGMEVEVSDGGDFAITTERLSASVSQFATAVPVGPVVAPSVNVKFSRKRKATVQMGCTERYGWLFIGTADATAHSAGVGVLAGAAVPGCIVGGTASVQFHGLEDTRPCGVLIHVERQPNADGSGYDNEAMRDRMQQVIDIVTGPPPGVPTAKTPTTDKDIWDSVTRSLLGARDVSVGWVDGTAKEKRHGASAGLIGIAGVPTVLPSPFSTSVSVSVPMSAKHVDSVSTLRNESGRIQMEKRHAERSIEVKIEAKVGASVSAAMSDAPKGSVSTGPGSQPLWEKQLYEVKVSLSRTLLTNRGKLDPRACFLDINFPDAAAYEYATRNMLGHDGDAGARAVSAYLEQGPAQDPEPLAKRAISAIKSKLEFGNEAKHEDRHIHRYALTEQAAERIDALQAHFEQWQAGLPKGLSATQINEARQHVDAKREQVLADPDSWRLDCLLTKQRREAHEPVPLLSALARGVATAMILMDANAGANRIDENEVVHHRFDPDAGVKPSIDLSMSSGITLGRLGHEGSHSLMRTPAADTQIAAAWRKFKRAGSRA